MLRAGPAQRILTVTQLAALVRDRLERGVGFVWVAGEISNFRPQPSGHVYFTLKDDQSQLAVVMFRSAAQVLAFRPADGMDVLVGGRPTVSSRARRAPAPGGDDGAARPGRAPARLRAAEGAARAGRALRPRTEACAAALSACGRHRDRAPRRRAPRHAHGAPQAVAALPHRRARRPRAGRRRRARDRGGDRRSQPDRLARRAARRKGRRVARGPLGVQRGGRRARDRGVARAGRVGSGARGRLHDRRLRRGRARADADRRRRAGRPRRDRGARRPRACRRGPRRALARRVGVARER
jgi:hypothetical protein